MDGKRLKKQKSKHFSVTVNGIPCRVLLCAERKERRRNAYVDTLRLRTGYHEDFETLGLGYDYGQRVTVINNGVSYCGKLRVCKHGYGTNHLSEIDIDLDSKEKRGAGSSL